jgi:hypothetical protein
MTSAIELLAIKLALEKWRHWLEGAQHPFTVLTDHKNIQYLQEAKCLNPRQTRWALFNTSFNFQISHRPGDKNGRANALSQIHAPEDSPESPKPILNPEVITIPIQWSQDENPASVWRQASSSTRSSKSTLQPQPLRTFFSGHWTQATANQTLSLSLLQDRFLWPSMAGDVRRFVRGCMDCTISKSPQQLPTGKLLPLPVTSRPWSHMTCLECSLCLITFQILPVNSPQGIAHCHGNSYCSITYFITMVFQKT